MKNTLMAILLFWGFNMNAQNRDKEMPKPSPVAAPNTGQVAKPASKNAKVENNVIPPGNPKAKPSGPGQPSAAPANPPATEASPAPKAKRPHSGSGNIRNAKLKNASVKQDKQRAIPAQK